MKTLKVFLLRSLPTSTLKLKLPPLHFSSVILCYLSLSYHHLHFICVLFSSPAPLISPSVTTVEGLDSLGLTSSGQGFFPSLQRQMETQLLADQEMMRRVLAAPFVQSTFSSASVQLTRQLIQSNPQTQQLLQTNPELKDVLYNSDVITQVSQK